MVKRKSFRMTDLVNIFSTKYMLGPIMMWKSGFYQKNYMFKYRHSLKSDVMQEAKAVPIHKFNIVIPDSKQSILQNGIVGKDFSKVIRSWKG